MLPSPMEFSSSTTVRSRQASASQDWPKHETLKDEEEQVSHLSRWCRELENVRLCLAVYPWIGLEKRLIDLDESGGYVESSYL